MDKLADIWRGRCKDDVENGTALQWRTVEEQIEVQRVMRPQVGGGALTLVDGDRGSQRAAFHVSRLAEKVGREFGSPITAVDWYWLVSHGLGAEDQELRRTSEVVEDANLGVKQHGTRACAIGRLADGLARASLWNA